MTRAGDVVFWREEVLPPSETFIRTQMLQLPTWRPQLRGFLRRSNGLFRPGDFTIADASRLGLLRLRLYRRIRWDAAVTKSFAQDRPDLVHVHFLPDAVHLAPTLDRLGIPMVITVHGYDVWKVRSDTGLRDRRRRARERTVLGQARLIIAVSNPVRDRVIALGAAPEKVEVVHLGLPGKASFDAPAEVERTVDILFVGRFVEKKGLNDLICALPEIQKQIDHRLRVVVVGSGSGESSARDLINRLGLNAVIDMMGFLSAHQIERLMEQSKLVVIPSYTASDGDAEGLPTVALEALHSGRAIVGYAHSGLPEAVRDGVNGYLVPERDRAALAQAAVRVLTDEDLRADLEHEARQLARSQFDANVQGTLLETMYARVCNASQADSGREL